MNLGFDKAGLVLIALLVGGDYSVGLVIHIKVDTY